MGMYCQFALYKIVRSMHEMGSTRRKRQTVIGGVGDRLLATARESVGLYLRTINSFTYFKNLCLKQVDQAGFYRPFDCE